MEPRVWDRQKIDLARKEHLDCKLDFPTLPPVVGLSLELGTTIINHVVPGTTSLAHLRSKRGKESHDFRILQRGHFICSVDGVDVDARNIAEVLSSGPVGSRVVVCARNESGQEYEVELIRQNAAFVEHMKKIQDTVFQANRESSSGPYGNQLKVRFLEIQNELESLAETASLQEQKMAESNFCLHKYIEMLESELLGRQILAQTHARNRQTRGNDASVFMEDVTENGDAKEVEGLKDSLLVQISALKKDLETVHADKAVISAKLSKMADVLREKELELEKERNERPTCDQVAEAKAAIREKESELALVMKKVKQLEEEIHDNKARALAEQADTKRKANTLLQQKDTELLAARRRIETLEKEATGQSALAKDLKQRITALEQNKLLLARESKAAQSAKQQEEKSRASLEQNFWRVGVLEKETANLHAALEKATKQMQDLQAQHNDKVAALMKDRDRISLELSETRAKANNLLAKKDDELSNIHCKLDSAEAEVARLKQLYGDSGVSNHALLEPALQREKDLASSEVSEIRRKANALLAQKSEELSNINSKVESLEKELARLKLEYSAIESRRSMVEKENANNLKEIVHLKQEKSSWEKERLNLISRLAAQDVDTAKTTEKAKLMERTIGVLKASQTSTAKELETLRASHEKLRRASSDQQKELQVALDNALKAVHVASAREKDKSLQYDREKETAAAELAETKRKANTLLAKKVEELSSARSALDKAEKEATRMKSELETQQSRLSAIIKEKDRLVLEKKQLEQERSRLVQRLKDLAESNARLIEQTEAETTWHQQGQGLISVTKSKDVKQSFEQNLLNMRIESLQTLNASLVADKEVLTKSLQKLQNVRRLPVSHGETSKSHEFESTAEVQNSEKDLAESETFEALEKVSASDEDVVEGLQRQLREAQFARDSAFKTLDSTITEALAQQIEAEKSYNELLAAIDDKEKQLHDSREERAEIEKQYGALAQAKERLDIELVQAAKASEIFEMQAAANLLEIQETKKTLANKDNLLKERALEIENLRSRYRDLEENLTNSVLTLQEKESQIRSLSSQLQETRSQLEHEVETAKEESLRSKQTQRQTEERLEVSDAEHAEVLAKCRRLELQLHDLSEILIESQQRWEREILESKQNEFIFENRWLEAQKEASDANNLVRNAHAETQELQDKVRDMEQSLNDVLKTKSHELELASLKEEAASQQIKLQNEKLMRYEYVEKQQLPDLVARCKGLEAHTQKLSDILVESQKRWESEITSANLKIEGLETQRTEAQQAARRAQEALKDSEIAAQSLRAKICKLEGDLKQLSSVQDSNQRVIQEQEDNITKLLQIEKKRLDTIRAQRSALKEADDASVRLTNEIKDLRVHLELAQARDASHVQSVEQLKAVAQEKQVAIQLALESEVQRTSEKLRAAELKIEQLNKENWNLKAEFGSLKRERAPWPNAISGLRSKTQVRSSTGGPMLESDRLRIQLDAVEKLAAERTEQVRNLERELGYLEEGEIQEIEGSNVGQRASHDSLHGRPEATETGIKDIYLTRPASQPC